jgi:hypothetical protein
MSSIIDGLLAISGILVGVMMLVMSIRATESTAPVVQGIKGEQLKKAA